MDACKSRGKRTSSAGVSVGENFDTQTKGILLKPGEDLDLQDPKRMGKKKRFGR